jgi:ribosomal protein S18 acetylase RimI-like enzyme
VLSAPGGSLAVHVAAALLEEAQSMPVTISALTSEQTDDAARLLARAFVTNPLHVAVFGPDQIRANEAFFRIGLTVMKGPKLAALEDGHMLGVIHWVDASNCQFSTLEKMSMLPAMLRGLGLRSAMKVGTWLSIWAKHDPAEPHVHLGPIGISPDAQGRGIGRQLMDRYCQHLEETRAAGYLETDRPGNVAFYKKFGFEVTGTATIHGVENYFMRS